ncbi:MAG: hypothetical protein RR336_02595 [Oscillospiraceae bacterium]
MADGKVVISTALDNKGFTKGVSGLKGELGGLKSVLGGIGRTIAVVFSVGAIVRFGKASVKAASDLVGAWTGLNSIIEGQGGSFAKAKSFIEDYIADGLVPLENAVTAYKNLAMRGYDSTQIEQTMTAFKNSASFGRQASLTMGQAVQSATEGLKNENSILVDNAGVTKNVSMMWKDYAESIGVGVQSLTKAQKIQAEYVGILHETRFQMGDAAKLSGTYAGQVSMLSFAFQQLKVAVGNAIIPIAKAVIPGIHAIISALTKLANVFGQVTALLFGSDKKIAAGGAGTAESVDAAADATRGMGSASKKAAKDMKGVLTGFDELNILAENAASSEDAAADGMGITSPEVGSAGTGEELFGGVTISPEVVGFIDDLRRALEPTKEALSGLWSELQKVGSFVWEGLKGFYESFLVPVGAWVLGAGLPKFVSTLTDGLALVDFATINTALQNLGTALAPFAVNVGAGLLWLWENVFVPFGTWVMNEAVPRFLELISLAVEGLNAIIELAKPAFQWLWDNFLQPVGAWLGESFILALDTIIGLFKIVVGILTGDFELAMEGAKAVVNGVKGAFELLKEVALAVWDAIVRVWGAAVKWFNDTVIVPLSGFFKGLWDDIALWASGAWKSISTAFQGAAKWFTDNIITPITSGFKGFFNGLIGFVEGFVNFFLRGINSIIGALNGLSLDVPEGVPFIGGTKFGVNIPTVPELKLPRLAAGAVIPANHEFAAILGDQKNGTNIETPLETMVQAFKQALSDSEYGGQREIVLRLVSDRGFVRSLKVELDAESRHKGVSFVRG